MGNILTMWTDKIDSKRWQVIILLFKIFQLWKKFDNNQMDCIRYRRIKTLHWLFNFTDDSHTATFTINRHLGCLWSKIDTFQFGIELCKWATMPILNWMFKNTIESFQMRYCMQFFLQGHQNCQNLKIYTSEFT